ASCWPPARPHANGRWRGAMSSPLRRPRSHGSPATASQTPRSAPGFSSADAQSSTTSTRSSRSLTSARVISSTACCPETPAMTRRAARRADGWAIHQEWNGLLEHGVQERPRGLLAAPARLCADPAVLVQLRVPLALLAAALANGRAGLEQGPREAGVRLGLATRDPDRCAADVGAVQT